MKILLNVSSGEMEYDIHHCVLIGVKLPEMKYCSAHQVATPCFHIGPEHTQKRWLYRRPFKVFSSQGR